MKSWKTQRLKVSVGDYHSSASFGQEPEIREVNPSCPTLVLGSRQQLDLVDRDALLAAGVDLVVRKSGGGVVYLHPGHSIWIDIWIPKASSWHKDDITDANTWVGQVWCEALASVGINTYIYMGKYIPDEVCFASRAHGEVMQGDSKIVGISQRRIRQGSWFQTLLLREWEPSLFVPYLNIEHLKRLDKVAKPIDLVDVDIAKVLFSTISNK